VVTIAQRGPRRSAIAESKNTEIVARARALLKKM